MNKILVGLIVGIAAGIIDVIPMLIQKLPWDANLSAFFMWIVIGLLLSFVKINVSSILRGLFISFLVLLPNLFIIGWKEPYSLIPIIIMTLILGSIAGFTHSKMSNKYALK